MVQRQSTGIEKGNHVLLLVEWKHPDVGAQDTEQ